MVVELERCDLILELASLDRGKRAIVALRGEGILRFA